MHFCNYCKSAKFVTNVSLFVALGKQTYRLQEMPYSRGSQQVKSNMTTFHNCMVIVSKYGHYAIKCLVYYRSFLLVTMVYLYYTELTLYRLNKTISVRITLSEQVIFNQLSSEGSVISYRVFTGNCEKVPYHISGSIRYKFLNFLYLDYNSWTYITSNFQYLSRSFSFILVHRKNKTFSYQQSQLWKSNGK